MILWIEFDCLCTFCFGKSNHYTPLEIVYCFLKINENILFSFKFEQGNVSENDMNENIIMQTIGNNYGHVDILINCFKKGKLRNNAF